MEASLYATPDLEMPRITEVPYENPDGSPIVWNRDYLGQKRALKPVPGSAGRFKSGYNGSASGRCHNSSSLQKIYQTCFGIGYSIGKDSNKTQK